MKRYKLFLIVLSLFLLVGLGQGCDSDDNGQETATLPTTTTTAAPTCSISSDPQIVRHGETSTFNIMITGGGPANGSFSPSSGGCTSFADSTGTSCTTTFLTMPGKNTFTLSVSNAKGSSSCFIDIFVGCKNYRVWNNTGSSKDFLLDGTCRGYVNNGEEITSSSLLLDRGETIKAYSLTRVPCMGSSSSILTYDNAMNADIGVRGGNGNCQVNFTGSDR